MIALISDLHSNQEALEAALRDLDAQRPEAVYCLGDVVGYGASPREVMELARSRCAAVLQGNHDAALLDLRDATGFNERALRALEWTRAALDPEREENVDLWDWLGALQPAMELDPGDGAETVHLVHASPKDPLGEYLLPALAADAAKLASNFAAVRRRLTFFGHTHHPGYFAEGAPFVRATGSEFRLRLEPARRYLINVGSVGQPRDGDPRLAYVLLEGGEVRWRRVEYDVRSASSRIERAGGLPRSLASRLLEGR